MDTHDNGGNDHRVQNLFLAALEIDANQRDTWLQQQCGDNQELLEQVRKLLHHDNPEHDPLEKGLDHSFLYEAGMLSPSSGLHVRCPHCQNPVEIIHDIEFEEIYCDSCGSSFSLISTNDTLHDSENETDHVTFQHFQLIQQVGMGAFGTVYKALDQTLDRFVAIKIPRKGQLTREESELFLREARAVAQLKHPNIVSVHEVGMNNDQIFIVSDFVEGLTLSSWLSGAQPTTKESAELLIKIARALHHAHERGIIHRDLKPGNIMLDKSYEPHLMDFGLAKREASEITMTVEGQVLGTPAYMSPEQARGEGHDVDRRSDIYSLGIILFELLTGERPFRGDVSMLLHQVLNEEPPSPRKLKTAIPKDLETISLKCMQKSPEQRYGTADEVASDLQMYLEGKTISARPVGHLEKGWRWCKRKPGVAVAWGSFLLLLLALGIGGPVLAVQQKKIADQQTRFASEQSLLRQEAENARNGEAVARKEAEENAVKAETNAALAVIERNEKANQLYLANMNIAHQEWKNLNAARTRQLLNLYLPENQNGNDYRSWEWDYLWRLSHSERQLIETTPRQESTAPSRLVYYHSLAFHPNGQFLYSGDHFGKLVIWSADGKKQIRKINAHKGRLQKMSLSTDGKLLATAGQDQKVLLWNTDDWTVVREFPGHRDIHYGLALSPKGDQIAIARNEIVIYDTAEGTEINRLTGHRKRIHQLQFSSDQQRLASCADGDRSCVWDLSSSEVLYQSDMARTIAISPNNDVFVTGDNKGNVAIWNAHTGKRTATVKQHNGKLTRIVFNSEGSNFITVGDDSVVRVWDTRQRKFLYSFRGHGAQVIDVACLPNSDRIATSSWDNSIRVWESSSQHELVKNGPVNTRGARFSPDGQFLIAATGKKLLFYHAENCQLIWERNEHAGLPPLTFPVRFSKDGNRVAAGRTNGIVSIRETKTGEVLFRFKAHKGPVTSLAFLPNNRLVTGNKAGEIAFWKKNTEGYLEEIRSKINRGMVGSLELSHDRNLLAIGGGDQDVTVKIWDFNENRQIQTLSGQDGRTHALVFSHDGTRLFNVGRGPYVTCWDVNSGELLFRQVVGTSSSMGISLTDDDRRLATSNQNGNVKIWDLKSGLEIITLNPEIGQLTSVSFSPDGTRLAVNGQAGGFVIYDSRHLKPEF